jgi:hypothetical protein
MQLISEEHKRQIAEIKYKSGLCPSNTLCDQCVCYSLLTLDGDGCNPVTALALVNDDIEKDQNI